MLDSSCRHFSEAGYAMKTYKTIRNVLLLGISSIALGSCGGGADDVASPGEGFVVVPAPTPGPVTPPPPTEPTKVTAAASCPTIPGPVQLSDLGTIEGPQGTWRNCGFPARFTASTQIPKQAGVIYSLPGRVDVGTDQGAASTNTDVTLTIDPGVTIFGATGVSFLVVNRGNKIDAVGTAAQPIVFTGRGNVTGSADDNTSQLWGGVVLLGRAPITDCLAPGATPGTVSCERDTEGTSNALYGGAQPADNSGRMKFVQIRYSGFVLSANSELQGLTPSGVGSNTELERIQIHNSSDDGIEIFGGRPNLKYLVLTGNEDDMLDTDVGYKGFIQFVIAVQRAGAGDSMIEADSNGNEDAVPRQNTRLANFTFVHKNTGGNNAAILLRGGTDYTLVNGVISSPVTCLRVNSPTTIQATGPDEAGAPVIRSVVAQCGSPRVAGSSGVTNEQVEALIAGNNNNFGFTTSLSNVFVNGAGENGVTPFNASTLNAFFINTNYIGAVRDANDTWYAGWACNSATANFGATSRSCTLIPV
jgi:hypothetical protein